MPPPFGRSNSGKPDFGESKSASKPSAKEEKTVDVDLAVKKIKSVYQEYSQKYGARIFNLKAFEERYRNALVRKLNLNVFLHAEITAVEELKKRVEGEKEKGPTRSGYGEIADRIIERNLERVKRYRSIDFHPDAEAETRYLLGAVTDFYEETWRNTAPLLKSLRVKGLKDFLDRIENDFAYYVIPFRGPYSRAADDYLLVLSRKKPKENEKAAVNFIRHGGILLNNCLRALGDGLNPVCGAGTEPGEEGEIERALSRSRETLVRLIEDFRLQDIRDY